MDSAAQNPTLQGVSSPTDVFAPLFTAVNISQITSVIAAVLFLIWVVYTIFASYHLVRYGYRSAVSIPAIIVHVAVSISLALFAVSGLT